MFDLKVGDVVYGGKFYSNFKEGSNVHYRAIVKSETPKFWVLDNGYKIRKSDGLPQPTNKSEVREKWTWVQPANATLDAEWAALRSKRKEYARLSKVRSYCDTAMEILSDQLVLNRLTEQQMRAIILIATNHTDQLGDLPNE